MKPRPEKPHKIPKPVVYLGIVSLFTDLSSEMIYPMLPVFLSQVLGAGALALGTIEGVAEATAALLKIASGLWTDRTQRRKPLILAGYGLAGLARPLIAFARSWTGVLGLRFADRVGKGIRSSPRDALIADVTEAGQRAAAYGFHRSLDHAGAVIGPLIAAWLLARAGLSLRTIFLLASIPAFAAAWVVLVGIKDPEASPSEPKTAATFNLFHDWRLLNGEFKHLLLAVFLFTLGNSADAFLLMRLSNVGVATSWIAILWSAHHVVKMAATYVGGRFADRVGKRRMILCGWLVYAAVYFAFARFSDRNSLIAIFLVYGLYFGLTEPAEGAWVADLVPAELRGTSFGFYHFVVGAAALPASLIFGLIWNQWGAPAAFVTGAGFALVAALVLLAVPPKLISTYDHM